jgi:hypothetical protein
VKRWYLKGITFFYENKFAQEMMNTYLCIVNQNNINQNNIMALTDFQNKLLQEIQKEFSRINPPAVNKSTNKRFSLASIESCKNEEEKYLKTVLKHNQTMVKVFEKQLKDEIKEFTKEFGKLFEVQLGYQFSNGGTTIVSGLENFLSQNANTTINNKKSDELHLFIVSKTKPLSGTNNLCKGKTYYRFYVDFKRESEAIVLESGKQINVFKIVGLSFISDSYLYRDTSGCLTTSTLDGYVQSSKALQQFLVSAS